MRKPLAIQNISDGMDGRTDRARCSRVSATKNQRSFKTKKTKKQFREFTQIFLKETFGCHIPIYRIMLLRKNSFDSLNLFNYDYMDEFLAGTDW